MKIGDKIYCKRDNCMYNLKDKIYKIMHISYKDRVPYCIYANVEENPLFYIYGYYFTEENGNVFSYHFSSLKEIRKQKLKKLNEDFK